MQRAAAPALSTCSCPIDVKCRLIFLVAALSLALALPALRPARAPVYDRAAERLIAGDGLYPADDPAAAFPYPPFLALCTVPFHYLPEYPRRAAWLFVSLLSAGAAFVRLRPSLVPPGRDLPPGPDAAFGAVLLVSGSAFLVAPIASESHDLLILVMIALMLAADRHGAEGRAGGLAGLAAAAAAAPLLFLGVLLWQRRLVAVIAMMTVAVMASLLPDLLFPRADGGWWIGAWRDMVAAWAAPGAGLQDAGAWAVGSAANQSLAGALHRLSTPVPDPAVAAPDVSLWDPGAGIVRAVILAAQAAVVAVLLWATRPLPGLRRLPETERALYRYGTASAVVAAMLLLSPATTRPAYCLLILPLSFALAEWWLRDRDPITAALLALAFLLGLGSAPELIGPALWLELQARGVTAFAGLACLLAAVRVMERRRSAARRGPGSLAAAGTRPRGTPGRLP